MTDDAFRPSCELCGLIDTPTSYYQPSDAWLCSDCWDDESERFHGTDLTSQEAP